MHITLYWVFIVIALIALCFSSLLLIWAFFCCFISSCQTSPDRGLKGRKRRMRIFRLRRSMVGRGYLKLLRAHLRWNGISVLYVPGSRPESSLRDLRNHIKRLQTKGYRTRLHTPLFYLVDFENKELQPLIEEILQLLQKPLK